MNHFIMHVSDCQVITMEIVAYVGGVIVMTFLVLSPFISYAYVQILVDKFRAWYNYKIRMYLYIAFKRK